MQIERRVLAGTEVRAEKDEDGEVRLLTGRGVPYGQWSSDLGGFRERFMPGSMRQTIADESNDIVALYNHESGQVLGRQSVGTLRIYDRTDGVDYEVDVNRDDPAAVSVAAKIARRDVQGNSFGFGIRDMEDQEWEERDGMLYRTIYRAEMRELGPQPFPAYPQTDVSARGEVRAVGDVASTLEEARQWLAANNRSEDRVRRLLQLQEFEMRVTLARG